MQTRQTLYALGMASLGLLAPATAAQESKPALAAPKNAAITAVDVIAEASATRITVTGTTPFEPRIQAGGRSASAIITVPGLWQAGRSGIRRVGKNGISFLRMGQFRNRPDRQVRIVANGREAQTWTVTPSADRTCWEIVLSPSTSVGRKAAAAPTVARKHGAPAFRPVPLAGKVENEPMPSLPIPDIRTSHAAPGSVAVHAPAPPPTPALTSRVLAPPPAVKIAEKAPPPAVKIAEKASESKTKVVEKPELLASAKSVVKRTAPVAAPQKPPVLGPAPVRVAERPTGTAVNAVQAAGIAVNAVQDPVNKLVSLDFVGADVTDVLKAISLQSGANIVAGPSVQGKVTVALKNVPLREALDWVTRLASFRYVYVRSDNSPMGTFVVGTGKEIALISQTAQIGKAANASISFFYADGASLKESILSNFPNVNITLVGVNPDVKKEAADAAAVAAASQVGNANPQAQVNDPSNSKLIPRGGVINVVGSIEEVARVKQFVEDTERSMIESSERDVQNRASKMASYVNEVYEVKYVNASELSMIIKEQVPGIILRLGPSQRPIGNPAGGSLTFGAGSGAGGVGGAATGFGGAGGVGGAAGGFGGGAGGSGSLNDMQANGGSGRGFGNQSTTLLLTGTAEDVTRAKKVAAQLDVKAPQLVFEAELYDVNTDDADNLGLSWDLSQSVKIGEDPTRDRWPVNFGAFTRTPYQIGAQLQAMVKRGSARVLARPKLTAQDNQSAIAFIGDQLNYVVNIQQTPQGQNVTTNTATVGITLRVTGKYNNDGHITLYVHPEVSTISSYLTVGSFTLPQTSTRFVDTTVRVKDGEMIGIGGLVRSEEFNNRQYVPFLSKLPVIGSLFQSTTKSKRKSEVMIFLTARLAKD